MTDARGITHLLCGRIHVRGPGSDDEEIAGLATRQEGIVGRSQLLELAVSRRAIEHRIAVGRLRPRHPGVYAVGHEVLTYRARSLAAVMSVWPGAAASHLSLAALWGIAEPPPGPIHVTATQARSPRRGIAIHRAALPPDEVTVIGCIPVTTVPRLLLDLSATEDARTVRRLVKRAEFERLTSARALEAILERHPRRRGRGTLAGIVQGYVLGAGVTRSELEDRFLEFIGERGLPRPETNVVIEAGGRRFEVDCLWRDAGLVVELDGRRAHGGDAAFDDDRARDRALIAAGLLPMRVTWAHLHHQPDRLDFEIRAALADRGGRTWDRPHRRGPNPR